MSKYSTSQLLTKRTATFSPCRRYRYTLLIAWDHTLPFAAFIGLNPSTADEYQDDPTIRRCRGFAEREGCGGMLMLNLFAWRSTDPKGILAADSPIGCKGGLFHLQGYLALCTGPHIACWGTGGSHMGRGPWLRNLLPGLQCFGQNADGSPKHPLYLRADTPLIPYSEVRA